MGLFDMLSNAFGMGRKEARILVIGLDNSGKTTLINHLKPKKVNLSHIFPIFWSKIIFPSREHLWKLLPLSASKSKNLKRTI
jgi:GTPase SAR1 family protein